MAKDCLYCGLQFSDTTNFCPNCGRPTESGFKIRLIQESEFDHLRREMKGKDALRGHQGVRGGNSGASLSTTRGMFHEFPLKLRTSLPDETQ